MPKQQMQIESKMEGEGEGIRIGQTIESLLLLYYSVEKNLQQEMEKKGEFGCSRFELVKSRVRARASDTMTTAAKGMLATVSAAQPAAVYQD